VHPISSAAWTVIFSRSSSLRNRIKMQSGRWYRAMPGTTETMPSDRAGAAPADASARWPATAASSALSADVRFRADGAEAGVAGAGLGLAGLAVVVAGLAAAAEVGDAADVDAGFTDLTSPAGTGLVGSALDGAVDELLLGGVKKGDAGAD
jgi:hypothetical protein